MSKLFEEVMKARLAEYSEPFINLIRRGKDEGARDLILQIQREHPAASTFIQTLFAGTPAQIVEGASAFWPGVRELPNVEAFAAVLQRRLLAEWNRPRPVLPPRRRP